MRGQLGASARDIKTGWNLHGNFSLQMRYDLAQSQEVPLIVRRSSKRLRDLVSADVGAPWKRN
jgi:hypothetical protein